MTCNTCRFWGKTYLTRMHNHGLDKMGAEFGDCNSKHILRGYGWCATEDQEGVEIEQQEPNPDPNGAKFIRKRVRLNPSQLIVENDEGWSILVGRDFGCIHHAAITH